MIITYSRLCAKIQMVWFARQNLDFLARLHDFILCVPVAAVQLHATPLKSNENAVN